MDLRLKYFQTMSVGAKTAAKKASYAFIDKAIAKALKETTDDFPWFYFTSLVKNEFIKRFKEIVERHHYRFSEDLINDCFQLIADNIIEESNSRNGTSYYHPFGIAQMLVNTFYKYLYLYKEEIDIDIDFSMCDCPLSSLVLNRLGHSDIKWFQIDRPTYYMLQEEIADQQDGVLGDLSYHELMEGTGNLGFELICQILG